MENRQEKRVLITGTTGFIGSHLVRTLVKKEYDIHCIVRRSSKQIGVLDSVRERITVHFYEENTNLVELLAKIKPNLVFHLASLFLAKHNHEDIAILIESNITFGTKLVDAMVQNEIYQLVNTGTSWQHYNNEAYNPVCLYAATKQAFENLLVYYQRSSPLEVITLKLFDTYGPADRRKKIFSLFNEALSCIEPIAMSPGGQLLDLVYIDDVIDAFVMAGECLQQKGNTVLGDYAVSSGKQIRLSEIAVTYEKISGRKLNIAWGKIPYRDREVMKPWDPEQGLPGWKAKVDLAAGIHKLINFCQA